MTEAKQDDIAKDGNASPAEPSTQDAKGDKSPIEQLGEDKPAGAQGPTIWVFDHYIFLNAAQAAICTRLQKAFPDLHFYSIASKRISKDMRLLPWYQTTETEPSEELMEHVCKRLAELKHDDGKCVPAIRPESIKVESIGFKEVYSKQEVLQFSCYFAWLDATDDLNKLATEFEQRYSFKKYDL